MLIKPPEMIDLNGPVVFLAGPIQGAPDWQSEAAKLLLNDNSKLSVASPRREYLDGEFVYEKQVDWETHYLRRAAKDGAVIFWLAKETVVTPGRAYAQTSRFELAEWKMRHERDGSNLIVGIEDGFSGERYIRRRLTQDCPSVPIFSSLGELCSHTFSILNI